MKRHSSNSEGGKLLDVGLAANFPGARENWTSLDYFGLYWTIKNESRRREAGSVFDVVLLLLS